MFVIFQNGIFYSFWQNLKTDKWHEITIQKLRLKGVSIFWYEGLYALPEFFRFDESFNLIIQKKNESDELVDDETISAELYFSLPQS